MSSRRFVSIIITEKWIRSVWGSDHFWNPTLIEFGVCRLTRRSFIDLLPSWIDVTGGFRCDLEYKQFLSANGLQACLVNDAHKKISQISQRDEGRCYPLPWAVTNQALSQMRKLNFSWNGYRYWSHIFDMIAYGRADRLVLDATSCSPQNSKHGATILIRTAVCSLLLASQVQGRQSCGKRFHVLGNTVLS
jgi:hypothetical protein